ncbi:UDP-glucose 4-epimerase GalE [Pseudoroseomonas wenyumeiae]|uniref:UDP-glucose 4-epimerase n=1 Tax=Teichococcus wenyumeiae TaxID=2478470 RepID=A0A3A9JLE6_9PROT|nr:UDP-glucose 4-epimerase GalE [Pseudoroseomonas wenyumeiae]RKK05375.1 UDP-glucose 4-epimerase GalE [Pseudoroseomonas wenyumeiae]RMI19148.1 UDP-glucose 4-epimerase GalE [Pseudoroseomonas wenyumeiae]
MERFLVTGGAGYVGSHVVLALLERGDEVVVLDDLRQGHRLAVPPGAELVVGDAADRHLLRELMASRRFDGILHFAAISLVDESMREPMRYIRENLGNTLALAEEAVKAGVMRLVLSSTAALFGSPENIPIGEDERKNPVSPYGESKLMAERALEWADRIHGLRSASLRYFNAAGADPGGRLGEDHSPETHLIPCAVNAVLGLGRPLAIHGTDYDTPDGTAIRDYVHVADLADAHLRVLDRLKNCPSCRYNVGSGTGASVLEVIAAVERAAGRPVPHVLGPRRAGDPAILIASNERLRRETGWAPRLGALDDIVRSAYAWRARNPRGYSGMAALSSGAGPGPAAWPDQAAALPDTERAMASP